MLLTLAGVLNFVLTLILFTNISDVWCLLFVSIKQEVMALDWIFIIFSGIASIGYVLFEGPITLDGEGWWRKLRRWCCPGK